jgi:hypothetical protein
MTSSPARGERSQESLTASRNSQESGDAGPRPYARHRAEERWTVRVENRIRDVFQDRRRQRAGVVVITVGFGLVLWFLRRPDQLLHPYVWVEEFQILNRYQTQGLLHAILAPVEGYVVLPTSFTVRFGTATTFSHPALIDCWVGTTWYFATLFLVLVAPSSIRLRWRVGFAALLVLAPPFPRCSVSPNMSSGGPRLGRRRSCRTRFSSL